MRKLICASLFTEHSIFLMNVIGTSGNSRAHLSTSDSSVSFDDVLTKSFRGF